VPRPRPGKWICAAINGGGIGPRSQIETGPRPAGLKRAPPHKARDAQGDRSGSNSLSFSMDEFSQFGGAEVIDNLLRPCGRTLFRQKRKAREALRGECALVDRAKGVFCNAFCLCQGEKVHKNHRPPPGLKAGLKLERGNVLCKSAQISDKDGGTQEREFSSSV